MNGNFIERENMDKHASPTGKIGNKSEKVSRDGDKEPSHNANHNRNNSSEHHQTTDHHVNRKSPQRCPSRNRPDLRVLIPPRSHTGHTVCNLKKNLDKLLTKQILDN